ncbi:MAG: hypothetical protein HY917_00090 [Candidatus Diapherotrites archaeon]|nr:hypothetical protein [Candidatus Diapherotrites archaeon]
MSVRPLKSPLQWFDPRTRKIRTAIRSTDIPPYVATPIHQKTGKPIRLRDRVLKFMHENPSQNDRQIALATGASPGSVRSLRAEKYLFETPGATTKAVSQATGTPASTIVPLKKRMRVYRILPNPGQTQREKIRAFFREAPEWGTLLISSPAMVKGIIGRSTGATPVMIKNTITLLRKEGLLPPRPSQRQVIGEHLQEKPWRIFEYYENADAAVQRISKETEVPFNTVKDDIARRIAIKEIPNRITLKDRVLVYFNSSAHPTVREATRIFLNSDRKIDQANIRALKSHLVRDGSILPVNPDDPVTPFRLTPIKGEARANGIRDKLPPLAWLLEKTGKKMMERRNRLTGFLEKEGNRTRKEMKGILFGILAENQQRDLSEIQELYASLDVTELQKKVFPFLNRPLLDIPPSAAKVRVSRHYHSRLDRLFELNAYLEQITKQASFFH